MFGPQCCILHLAGQQGPADMPAAALSTLSRGGDPLTDEQCRRWRGDLAEAVGPGTLADLLRGPGSIRVTWETWPPEAGDGGHYVFWPAG